MIVLIALALAVTSAESPSMILCDVTAASYMTGCHVDGGNLLLEQEAESTFSLDYSYQCVGNMIDIFAVTEAGRTPLIRGMDRHRITLNGQAYIRLEAAAPETAYRAYVDHACRLEILNVTVAPSFMTLLHWQEQQHQYVKSLPAARYSWQSAQEFSTLFRTLDARVADLKIPLESILRLQIVQGGFEVTKILQPNGELRPASELPETWPLFRRRNPLVAHVLMAINVADRIARHRVIEVGPAEILAVGQDVGSALVEHWRENLQAELAGADALLQKLSFWNQEIDKRLQELAGAVRASLGADPASGREERGVQ